MENVNQNIVSFKKIRELLPEASFHEGSLNLPEYVTSVSDDSRESSQDGIFVAIKGYESDGHEYIKNALDAGATLCVLERSRIENDPSLVSELSDRSYLVVENTRLAASILAAVFYGNPSDELKVHGITGTKGKTTTAHITGGIFEADRKIPGVMGTLGIEFGEKRWKSDLTTPGPVKFQKILRGLADKGASDLICEVSAHAGALSRTSSVRFESVLYMNLSRDHGDHFDENEYLEAKKAIFRDAVSRNPEVWGIANIRDPHGSAFLEYIKNDRRFTFGAFEEDESGEDKQVDLRMTIQKRSRDDLHLEMRASDWTRKVRLPLIGRFNAQNAAAAASIGIISGIDPDVIVDGLQKVSPVPGRLERIRKGQEFLLVVDYAHAPQPAHEALATLREITRGKLIGVMGAGGSRDRGKRPMIGEVMTRDCDVVVITSDNPRKEEPLDIINDILVGVTRAKDDDTELIVEVDRQAAIGLAMERALPGDTVAILGKGHEDYQIFKDETIHFDDREVASEWLDKLGFTG